MQRRRTRVFIGLATALLLALGSTAVSATAAQAATTGTLEGTVRDAATNTAIGGATVSSAGVTATTGADGHYTLTLDTGEHTVTATAYGYTAGTASVTIVEGGTTGQDFGLTAAGSITLSGKVTDGSGHGWALYARLDITGYPGGPVFTNPATGKYTVQIAAGATYSVKVTALIPGYQVVTRAVTVGAGNTTANIAVPVAAGCTAPGYHGALSDPLLTETFDGTTAPAGWTVVNRGTGGWAFDDPGARGNLTGGTGGFAIADSDHAGSGTTTDTDLVTPSLDFSALPAPQLSFNSDFKDTGSEDFTDVDFSTDNGASWTNVYHQTDSRRGPTVETVPLDAAGGKAAVKLRFHYFGTWDWWWAIDNVTIVNRTCTPVPGGLVVGFTTDKNTGTALNGVKVSTPGGSGVSAPTPDDPTIADGFYWLFSTTTGSTTVTATKPPYVDTTKTVNIAADGTVRADFVLKAGRIVTGTSTIEVYATLGQTRSTSFSVTNNGSAPARVDFIERGGDFSVLHMQGAKPKTLKIPDGIDKGYKPFKHKLSGGQVGAAQIDDAAWTTLPGTPQPISDNAAVNIDGKAYSVGGGSGTGNEKKTFVYDGGVWRTLADMPTARSKPAAAAIDGKIYVFGGWGLDGNPLASTDVYDPGTNTWSTLPATNPDPVSAAGVAVTSNAVYLVGGCADSDCTDTADVVRYDIAAGTFSAVAAYPHGVAWPSCGGIDEKVYCAGGAAADSFSDGYSYDPGTNAWTRIADMPVDMWGAQYAAASGMLVIAGGIANNSSEITNQTIGYDPATNQWSDLPAATYPRARGAAACGVFKIGGWSGAFTPAPESEQLDGLGSCTPTVSDVPWLSENPAGLALSNGQTKSVTVTMAATQENGVTQPGDYIAEIGIQSNTPYPTAPVKIIMHVQAPSSWGKFQGTVTGTPCGGTKAGVPAYIRITSTTTPDLVWSVRANGDGSYQLWLPKGNYQLIAAKDDWAPQATTARLQAGFVVTVNFDLVPFTPCK
jgi:hypothetical protein